MRKRFNRVAIASSENYRASKKAHIEMLRENHETNSSFFMSITIIEHEKSDLELFIEKVKRVHEEAKRKRAIEEAEFKAKFKALLKH